MNKCNETLRRAGMEYPRTCQKCGLGPCPDYKLVPTTSPTSTAKQIAAMVDGMPHRVFCDFVDDIKSWVEGNTSKSPVEKWRSAISAWAENTKEPGQ